MNNENMQKIVSKHKEKRFSPLRSIKWYCKEQCCVGDTLSWKNCTFTACFLHKYRLGKGNRVLSEKQRATKHFFTKKVPLASGQEAFK